jgi:hypothetical protein
MLKDNNYLTILPFMVNDLGLSGSSLMIYAVIYSFSQDEKSQFCGSIKYMSEWAGVDERSVRYNLDLLLGLKPNTNEPPDEDKKLIFIEKRPGYTSRYRVNPEKIPKRFRINNPDTPDKVSDPPRIKHPDPPDKVSDPPRIKHPDPPDKVSDDINLNINNLNITHTNSGAGENPGAENKAAEEKPEADADPPMIHHHYPVLDVHKLFEEMKAAGFPDPGGVYRLNLLLRDLLPYFDGLSEEQILAAIRNYGLVKHNPQAWWNSNPNILTWAQKHLTNFLSENFQLEYYLMREERKEDPETAWRQQLEAQISGGGHGTE